MALRRLCTISAVLPPLLLAGLICALALGGPGPARAKIIHHGQVKKEPADTSGKGRVSWLGPGHCPLNRFKGRRSLFLASDDTSTLPAGQAAKANPFLLLNYYKEHEAPPESLQIEGRTRLHLFFVDWKGELGGQKVVFSIYHTPKDQLLFRPLEAVVGESGICRERMALCSIFIDPPQGMERPGSIMKKADWQASRSYGPRLVKVSTLAGYKDFGDGRPAPLPGRELARMRFRLMPAGVTLY